MSDNSQSPEAVVVNEQEWNQFKDMCLKLFRQAPQGTPAELALSSSGVLAASPSLDRLDTPQQMGSANLIPEEKPCHVNRNDLIVVSIETCKSAMDTCVMNLPSGLPFTWKDCIDLFEQWTSTSQGLAFSVKEKLEKKKINSQLRRAGVHYSTVWNLARQLCIAGAVAFDPISERFRLIKNTLNDYFMGLNNSEAMNSQSAALQAPPLTILDNGVNNNNAVNFRAALASPPKVKHQQSQQNYKVLEVKLANSPQWYIQNAQKSESQWYTLYEIMELPESKKKHQLLAAITEFDKQYSEHPAPRPDFRVKGVIDHKFDCGQLYFTVKWMDESVTLEPYHTALDSPAVLQYIRDVFLQFDALRTFQHMQSQFNTQPQATNDEIPSKRHKTTHPYQEEFQEISKGQISHNVAAETITDMVDKFEQ